jgi:hypothetical protein
MRNFSKVVALLVVVLVSGSLIPSRASDKNAVLQVTPTPEFGPVTGGSDVGQATAVATVGPTATPPAALKSDLMGIQAYGNLQQGFWWQIVDRAGFMGFKWMKVQLSW